MKPNLRSLFTTLGSLALLVQTATAQQWTTNKLPPGLISWWNADGNTLDVTGLNPASSAGQTYGPGRFGQAFHFDGVSQSVAAPGSASLDQWTQFTLEAWMKLDRTEDEPYAAPGRMVINRVGNPNDHVNYNQGYQFGFWNNARNLVLAFNTNGQAWTGFYTEAVLPAPLPTNVWLHYAATYDHNAVTLYLNGVPLKTNVVGAATVAHSTSSFRIGMDDNGNCPFPGALTTCGFTTAPCRRARSPISTPGRMLPVTPGPQTPPRRQRRERRQQSGRRRPRHHLARPQRLGSRRDSAAFPALRAPVYRTNALNGRAGVDFGLSGSDSLATASAASSTSPTARSSWWAIGSNRPTHVSISAPACHAGILHLRQGIHHHSSPYH